jgi:hypothetical protein
MPSSTTLPDSDTNREINLKYNIPQAGLFEITYLTADLMELVVLSTLIENQNYPLIDDPLFYDDLSYPFRTPYRLSRRSMEAYYRRYPQTLSVKNFHTGSIELTLAAVSAVGSIIIPFVILYIQSKVQTKHTERVISVSTNDKYVQDFLREMEDGQFGSFDEAFPLLRNILQHRGHSIEAVSPTVFRVLDSNARRSSRVIETAFRINR